MSQEVPDDPGAIKGLGIEVWGGNRRFLGLAEGGVRSRLPAEDRSEWDDSGERILRRRIDTLHEYKLVMRRLNRQ